jgi:hypothetical protein
VGRAATAAALAAGVGLLLGAAPVAAGSGPDQTIVQAGVIRVSDVPAGWQAGAQNDVGARQFVGRACQTIRAAYATAQRGPHLLSSQFSDPASGGTTLAENVVFVFTQPATATKLLSAFQAARAPACLRATVQRQAGIQGQVARVTRIANLQAIGNGAVGYEVLVRFNGISAPLVVDDLGVRVGRSFVGFTFTNVGSAVPTGHVIVSAVVARLAKAGA